jgi:hypothetical protein
MLVCVWIALEKFHQKEVVVDLIKMRCRRKERAGPSIRTASGTSQTLEHCLSPSVCLSLNQTVGPLRRVHGWIDRLKPSIESGPRPPAERGLPYHSLPPNIIPFHSTLVPLFYAPPNKLPNFFYLKKKTYS